eukprot:EG_transcript_21911
MGCASSCVTAVAPAEEAPPPLGPLAGAGPAGGRQPLILLVQRGEGDSDGGGLSPSRQRYASALKRQLMKHYVASFDRLEQVEEEHPPINLRALFGEGDPAGIPLSLTDSHARLRQHAPTSRSLVTPATTNMEGPASYPPFLSKAVATTPRREKWAEPRPPTRASRVARFLPPHPPNAEPAARPALPQQQFGLLGFPA